MCIRDREITEQKLELEQQINSLLGEITVLEQDIDCLLYTSRCV